MLEATGFRRAAQPSWQLSPAGFIFVCGQALHAQHLNSDSLAHDIAVSLSALTSIIHLQQQGYALVPL